MTIRTKTAALLATAGTILAACGGAGDSPNEAYTYELINNEKVAIGTVMLTENTGGGVDVRVIAETISPGPHGMHLHETGDCSAADFTSAGGHINPMDREHGLENPDGPDNADMPNATADGDGRIDLTVTNERVSLTGEGDLPALLDANGSALILHENEDDQMTQPIGGAGARIACAAIVSQ